MGTKLDGMLEGVKNFSICDIISKCLSLLAILFIYLLFFLGSDIDMELMKEKFAKLLLGEDMSGGGKGVSSALALSNAITNLAGISNTSYHRLHILPRFHFILHSFYFGYSKIFHRVSSEPLSMFPCYLLMERLYERFSLILLSKYSFCLWGAEEIRAYASR